MTHLHTLEQTVRAGALVAGLAFVASGVSAQQRATDMANEASDLDGEDFVQALRQSDLTVYADLVEAAGVGDALAGEGPLTIFVPTNAAFARVPEDVVKGPDRSRRAVEHVAMKGTLDLEHGAEATSLQPFATVGGVSVVTTEDGELSIRDSDQTARIVGDPIRIGHHTVLPIDTALLPERDSMDDTPR